MSLAALVSYTRGLIAVLFLAKKNLSLQNFEPKDTGDP